ncbi:MAG: M20/M25/M40 family metallo-hydrolase [Nanoarchaeota archaeon]|nr:M20/M25/M40 family metallo-hydrolase [Nanoarchaeota archaeon]MBU1704123.1 M20/M25/M40 family metallo-hydrolase [Nanoarchaeota archaeon]
MQLLNDLLVDSHSGNYNQIVSIITKYLKDLNCKVILQKTGPNKTNIIAIFGSPKLLINCHMDTVPPCGKWKTDPLKLNKINNQLYGLGTADTKGNIYAVLKAVKQAKPKNLMLLFSTDEESGTAESGVTHFLKSNYSKYIKKAIVCEPTSLNFVNKHKGYFSYILKYTNKPMHSSQKSENAIVKAAKSILEYSKQGYNIAKIDGGLQGNITPGYCNLKISKRSYTMPMKNPYFKGIPFNNKKPFIKCNKKVGFWTEAALFQEAGINTVVFGAGSIKQAHSPDEYVKINELKKAQEIIKDAISNI